MKTFFISIDVENNETKETELECYIVQVQEDEVSMLRKNVNEIVIFHSETGSKAIISNFLVISEDKVNKPQKLKTLEELRTLAHLGRTLNSLKGPQ